MKVRCLAKIRYGTLPSKLSPNATKKTLAAATSQELTHEIQDSDDWISVEEVVARWVGERKNVHVDRRVDYVKSWVTANSEEEIYISNIEEPSGRHEAAEKCKYKLAIAMQIILDEIAVESSSQSSGEFITSIMQHHQCQNSVYKQFKAGGVYLNFKHELPTCLPLNLAVLAVCNETIIKGKLPELVRGPKTYDLVLPDFIPTLSSPSGPAIQQYLNTWPGLFHTPPVVSDVSPLAAPLVPTLTAGLTLPSTVSQATVASESTLDVSNTFSTTFEAKS